MIATGPTGYDTACATPFSTDGSGLRHGRNSGIGIEDVDNMDLSLHHRRKTRVRVVMREPAIAYLTILPRTGRPV